MSGALVIIMLATLAAYYAVGFVFVVILVPPTASGAEALWMMFTWPVSAPAVWLVRLAVRLQEWALLNYTRRHPK